MSLPENVRSNINFDKLKRIKWSCRRGMLELDVLLLPFAERHFEQLSPEQQSVFEHLLKQDDPELFAWFMGHECCPEPALAMMINLIIERKIL